MQSSKQAYLAAKSTYDAANKACNAEMDTLELNAMLDAGQEDQVSAIWAEIMKKHNICDLRDALQVAEKAFLADSKQNILTSALQLGKNNEELKLLADTFSQYEANKLFVPLKQQLIDTLLKA